MSYYLEPFPFSDGGGPSSGSAAVEKVTVIVVHAGFGDCTLLEVLHDDGEFCMQGQKLYQATGNFQLVHFIKMATSCYYVARPPKRTLISRCHWGPGFVCS